jgi:D-glycero-alpha-D-manno-heptose-7-phosphate kinase
MIVTRTPFRISFFGGGTDYPAWYRENGGSVLATTINKYCYINCRRLPAFFDHKHRIIYSKMERVLNTSEINHPAVRGIFDYLEVQEGLEVHHHSDLPARSGLGSSSAFTVALLSAVKALRGELASKHELASTAIHIEQNVIGEAVGSQDQISAAYGGLNRIDFKPDGSFVVSPLILSHNRKELFSNHLMLFFTGFVRTAALVAQSKIDNMKNRHSELVAMGEMVNEGTTLLQSDSTSIEEIGKLLHQSWKLKRSLSSSVSNANIDEIYQGGLSAGAVGGKILGAGGGGFILFVVKPEDQKNVREKLSKLLYVPIEFEEAGNQLVYYEPSIEFQ